MSNSNSCCAKFSPYFLSLLRVVIAALIICHGGQKLFGYPGAEHGNPPLPPHLSLLGIAGILEFFGGLLLLMGLFTRPAAFILSGQMAVAYFKVHAPMAWWPIHNHGELAIIFCFVFLYLSAAGGGALSVDNCCCRKGSAAPPPSPA